jgi:predicted phosphoadenosine phosphosulfate sulfurtransferase
MGTNYYWLTNICKCCNREEERVHIGKSSAGWPFLLHPRFKSWTSWKEALSKNPDDQIHDEYGRRMEVDAFIKFVEEKQSDVIAFNDYRPDLLGYEAIDQDGFRINKAEVFC